MRILLAAVTTVAALTSGCGLRGDLERPMPLWGDPPRDGPDDPRTVRELEERARAEKEREDAARRAEEEALRNAAPPAATPTPASPPPPTPQ